MKTPSTVGIVALIILSLGAGVYVLPKTLPDVVPVKAASMSISLVGTYPYWNNTDPTIVVTKGDAITITVSTTDTGTSHRLLIDFDNDGVSDTADCGTIDQCSSVVTSTSPSTVGPFTVSSVGDFPYYCTIHQPPYMTGTFRVQNPPAPQVPNFSISSSPPTLTVSPGSSVTSTVTLASQNGFSGTVALSASVSPSGPQVSVSPSSVMLQSGSTATATVTATASGSGYYSTPTPTGSYTITVNATAPSLSHSTTVAVTVGSSASGGANLPIPVIVGGSVAGVAIIGFVVYLIRRRK